MSIFDGRGRWYRWDTKRTTDALLQLDIAKVRQIVDFDRPATGSLRWGKASVGYTVRPGSGLYVSYKVNGAQVPEYLIPVVYTTPNYGGQRPWFRCPNRNCGRRVRILYCSGYFLCRQCQNLTYESAQVGHIDRGRVVVRNRISRLRNQLGGGGGIYDDLPDRPAGMSWRRYMATCLEYQELLRLDDLVMSLSIIGIVGGLELDLDVTTNELQTEIQEVWREHKRAWKDGIPEYAIDSHVRRLFEYCEDDGRSSMPQPPDRLTLGELATLAGVSYAFAKEAVNEGLIAPDKGRTQRKKRYRRRLASWIGKLERLRLAGYTWDEIRDWTRRRWDPGHEHERVWPAGYEEGIAHGQANEAA